MRRVEKLMAGAAFAAALALGGCGFSLPEMAPAPAAPPPEVKIAADDLVGDWGLASYRKDEDRERTEKEAAAQCNKPYVISKGVKGGVMMYLADESKASELVIKVAPDGKVYLGPPGDPGQTVDREVLSFDGHSLVTRFVDPDAADRYGTMVFVRCGAKAAKPMKARPAKAKAAAKPAKPQTETQ